MGKFTTAGILATLGTLSAGTAGSFYAASHVASKCAGSFQYFANVLTGTLTLPGYTLNVTAYTPNITTEAFGMNITFPGGAKMQFPVTIPNLTLPMADLVNKSIIDAVNELPGSMESVCFATTLQTGLAYTAFLSGMIGLLTYAYHKNNTLRENVHRLRRQTGIRDHAADEDIELQGTRKRRYPHPQIDRAPLKRRRTQSAI